MYGRSCLPVLHDLDNHENLRNNKVVSPSAADRSLPQSRVLVMSHESTEGSKGRRGRGGNTKTHPGSLQRRFVNHTSSLSRAPHRPDEQRLLRDCDLLLFLLRRRSGCVRTFSCSCPPGNVVAMSVLKFSQPVSQPAGRPPVLPPLRVQCISGPRRRTRLELRIGGGPVDGSACSVVASSCLGLWYIITSPLISRAHLDRLVLSVLSFLPDSFCYVVPGG